MARDGHGTTLTFGTSGFSANLIGVEGPGMERAAIETTHMSTADAKEYLEAALYDGGSVDLVFEHNGNDNPPIDQPQETVTIDWAGSGNTWAGTAFMTNYRPGAAIGERMQATATLKVSGTITEA